MTHRLLILFLLAPFICNAQSELTTEYKSEIVEKITENMVEGYVYEDVALKMKSALKSALSKGKYDTCSSYSSFSKALNETAQEICHDKHLRIRPASNNTPRRRDSGKPMVEGEMLDGNIGLVTVNSFGDAKRGKKESDEVLAELVDAEVLIFDLRENQGGSPMMVQYLSSYLFEGEVLLNSLYWRERDRTDHFYTFEEVNGKKFIDVPVFVLTSNKTFSAAEEFTYNLQSRKRATIVGEVTGGGAHPVNLVNIDKNIVLVLPVGRAINPITKTNWEGTGIKPDIETKKSNALTAALQVINQ